MTKFLQNIWDFENHITDEVPAGEPDYRILGLSLNRRNGGAYASVIEVRGFNKLLVEIRQIKDTYNISEIVNWILDMVKIYKSKKIVLSDGDIEKLLIPKLKEKIDEKDLRLVTTNLALRSRMHELAQSDINSNNFKFLSSCCELEDLHSEICNIAINEYNGNRVLIPIDSEIGRDRFEALELALWQVHKNESIKS